MNMPTIKSIKFLFILIVLSMLNACDHAPKQMRTPNMTTFTSRLQPVFEKTKSVCFGRFIIDVPDAVSIVWGESIVPYDVNIYPNGLEEVVSQAQKFIVDLKSEKAIYQNHV